MNIAAVEEKTGLTRANIRYYESEGLLCPERLENGYRNYTDDHVETLLKIKLLRKLQVPLEEIRAVQAGTETLEQILGRQAGQLAQQARQLDHARDVCRAICDDGAEYSSMDTRRYLQILESGSLSERWQQEDQNRETPHPWRRYFARDLDTALYGVLIAAVWFGLLHQYPTGSGGESFLVAVASLALTLFLEPMWLHLCGTTPGKYLMGIRVYGWYGDRLSYRDGLQRTWDCLVLGVGLHIPIFNLYRGYRSYRQCLAGEVPWDEDVRYTYREPGAWRIAAFVAAFPVVFLLVGGIVKISILPPNRGELTVAEFAENYNYYVKAAGGGASSMLDPEGRWQETDMDPNVIVVSLGDATTDVYHPEFQYTMEDGVLTGISYELSGTGSWIPDYDRPLLRAAMAFVGAQKELGTFGWGYEQLVADLEQQSAESFTENHYGVDISWTVETQGLHAGGGYLIAEDQECPGSYRIALELKLSQ